MSVVLSSLSIGEIRERFLDRGEALCANLGAQMRSDPRQGVRRIWQRLQKLQQRQQREEFRMNRIQRFERVLWARGLERVAGVDEAGVGPLAGPVVAAAAIFPVETVIEGVDDSKQLDEETRLKLVPEIRRTALAVSVGVATVEEIDRLNIYHASLLAMRRAVEGLHVSPQFVLTDARRIPELDLPQRPVCKGDTLSFSIAAASIIAKTHRDDLMQQLDRRFPRYGFSRHKGYATEAHRKAIRRHGPCSAHRKSFPIVSELNGDCSPRFYELLDELQAAASLENLDQLRLRLRNRCEKEALALPELQRLRLLLARSTKNLQRQA